MSVMSISDLYLKAESIVPKAMCYIRPGLPPFKNLPKISDNLPSPQATQLPDNYDINATDTPSGLDLETEDDTGTVIVAWEYMFLFLRRTVHNRFRRKTGRKMEVPN